ncbi:flagellar basal-body MS-ring/collar protein FliF [Sanguibacter sp. Leaf3]|uniref:flagellar basal-body MS-ring/collar protein FliF n=1 Tax=Sanguibacter sp. Leaf3 TaxID=1736209 RepID=UPI0006F894A4|nr:flagellar basal-body MS-ring/collar protein FliF [Sanguibacter sp. Leaf3]KQT99803.1 flagellar M-ring protein FliF [Sanguibacter sp. Leaf3]
MPQQITSALGRVTSSIREFTVAQRTLALIGLAVAVVGVVALSMWFNRPQFSPLYTDLAPADASAIVDQLTTQGVKYQLTNGGSTVLVPTESVYDMRLKVAASGMSPSADGGYSLLDDMGMTSSEFQQDVTYKRALEGEMGKTVSSMEGVELATVKLAMPAESVFVDEATDPTASVFVKTRSGVTLTDDQVQSIVNLVSASVEGMKATDVAVIDASGTVLSAVGTGLAAGGANKQTVEYEQRVAQSIQSMLEPIVGQGKAVVTVTADLDYDATERTQESFSSAEGVLPLTERSTTENYTGTGNPATGVLGPDNIQVPVGEGAGDGSYTNETNEANNAVDKLTEHTVTAPGTVRRQSVSVAVDAAAAAAVDMAQLQAMVSSASGFDEARGDVVTVSQMPFDTSSAESAQAALDAAAAADEAAARSQMMRTLIIAGAALLAVILLAIFLARRNRNRADPRESLDLGDLPIMDEPLALEPADLDTQLLELPEVPELPSAEQISIERKRNDVALLVDEQPEQVAELLRGWMDQRSSV